REGFAATLVTREELKLVKQIEQVTGEQPIWIGEPPTEEDYAEATRSKRRRRRSGKVEPRSATASPERKSKQERPRREKKSAPPTEAASSPVSQVAGEAIPAQEKTRTSGKPRPVK